MEMKKHKVRKMQEDKINVVLISLDTVRADHLSAYGYKRKTTPNLEKIAKNGILFRQAVSPAGYTLPAHASLFTGLYSSRLIPKESWVLENQEQLIQKFSLGLKQAPEPMAQLFQNNGYLTAGFTGDAYIDGSLGFSKGFSEYFDFPTILGHGYSPDQQEDKTKEIFKSGIEWLRRNRKNSPFFLFLHTYEAHQPHGHTYFTQNNPPPLRLRKLKTPVDSLFTPTKEEREFAIDLYDSSIFCVDRYLGDLMEELDRLHLVENTLLIILSDHGEDIWNHTCWDHGEMYEEVLRVPLIFLNFPNAQKNIAVTTPVSLLDLYPTLVESLNLKRSFPYPLDGRSLISLFQDKIIGSSTLFSEHMDFTINPVPNQVSKFNGHYISVRQENMKYISRRFLNGSPHLSSSILEESLFDLHQEPGEKINLSGNSSDILNRLRNLCNDMLFLISKETAFIHDSDYSLSEEIELMQRLRDFGYV